MLLLIGPPRSGKTQWCLDRMRASLRARAHDHARLLLPTTTMAEHLRNELAREGFVFSPRAVSTFGKFINEFVPGMPAAPSAVLELIIENLLSRLPLRSYERVREFPGFRRALVRAVEEFSAAGGTPEHLPPESADFALLCSELLAELRRRGLYLRSARLIEASRRITETGPLGSLFVTGFFSFTPPETAVLKALSTQGQLTVTAPESSPALEAFATEVRTLEGVPDTAARALVVAPTTDAEVNEIARRLYAENAAGRPWRDMGVLLRTDEPYGPALRTAFERYGIPARFYFGAPLQSDASIRFLRSLAEAMLSGWDHQLTLRALRLPGSPLERAASGDRFDYDVRERWPARGLETLRSLAPPWAASYFDDLAAIDKWAKLTSPPAAWRARFSQLRGLFRPPAVHDSVPAERSLLWKTQAAALEQFEAALDSAAMGLDAGQPISCGEFWHAVDSSISNLTLRLVDHRRDVVHVFDAVEARQWKLPVLFICGLLEQHFPRYHSEDPILPDSVRRTLQSAGVTLKTSGQRQVEEQALFDLSLTRGSQLVVMTYPQLNGKGEPNLPSFFLERARPFAEESSAPVRPAANRRRGGEPRASINDEGLRAVLSTKALRLSPTGIEAYLQCPYQFFAQRVLRLAEPPDAAWDRQSPRIQGEIAHKVFELHYRDGIPVRAAFDEAFEAYARDEFFPRGYRTEAKRLELLHGIERFVDKNPVPRGANSRFEESFEFTLEGLTIAGKIDRLESDANGNVTVYDYKYKRPLPLKNLVNEHEERTRVQGGMYLLGGAALGLTPTGMAFCGFKHEPSVKGWIPGKDSCTSEAVGLIMQNARELAVQTATNLTSGRVHPEPADEDHCRYCSYAAMCRIDVAAIRTAVAGGART